MRHYTSTIISTPSNVQIVIDRDRAIVSTDDRPLQSQMFEALQTTRTSYEVTLRGLKMNEEMVHFAFSEDGFNVAPTLVPRLVKTAVEAG